MPTFELACSNWVYFTYTLTTVINHLHSNNKPHLVSFPNSHVKLIAFLSLRSAADCLLARVCHVEQGFRVCVVHHSRWPQVVWGELNDVYLHFYQVLQESQRSIHVPFQDEYLYFQVVTFLFQLHEYWTSILSKMIE